MNIYVSFVDKDRALVDELDVHLKPMQRQGKISFWHRGKATAATKLAEETARELAAADIVLAFVSPRYNADDDCERELRGAVAAGKRPIPILAEAAPLNDTYFDGRVSLPRDNEPLTGRRDLDAALVTIVQEIRGMMEKAPIQAPPAPAPGPSASSAQAQLSMSILFTLPFPWSDSRARSLHEQLVKACPRVEKVGSFVAEAGMNKVAIAWNQPVDQIWRDVLELAASSRTLEALLSRVLADSSLTAYRAGIRAAILPATLP